MIKTKKSIYILLLFFVVAGGLCHFSNLVNKGIRNLQKNPSFTKIPEFAWSLNLPLQAGSMVSDKVQQVVICQVQHYKRIFSRFSLLFEDGTDFDLIIRYNSDIFQSLQLRTSSAFNCELQI